MMLALLLLALAHPTVHVHAPPEVHGHVTPQGVVVISEVKLDSTVLLDLRPVEAGDPAPAQGVWMDTDTAVHLARADMVLREEARGPGLKWIGAALVVGLVAGVGGGLWLARSFPGPLRRPP